MSKLVRLQDQEGNTLIPEPMFRERSITVDLTDYGTLVKTISAAFYDFGYWGIVLVNQADTNIQGLTFSTLLQIERLPIIALGAFGFVRSLGSNQDGMDKWQTSSKKIYLRKVGSGNLLGTFGANPILNVVIVGLKNSLTS